MRVYQLDECMFDYLTALEDLGDCPKSELSTEGYALTDEKREALSNRDIGALYALGTRPYGMGVILHVGDGR
jgi:hypothetical protein